MLPATPSRPVRLWFDWYCRRALRRHFHAVHLYGRVPFDPARPAVVVANHVGFWDPIVLNHWLGHDRPGQPTSVMAELAQVRLHPFFRRVGAFSVDRADPRDRVRAVRHAADLLRDGHTVVIFPQGGVQPQDARPVAFLPGVERILSLAPAAEVVVMAIRYDFWADQRPELLLDVSAGVGRTTLELRRQLTDRLDALAAASQARRTGDRLLVAGRPSISDWAARLPTTRRP